MLRNEMSLTGARVTKAQGRVVERSIRGANPFLPQIRRAACKHG